MTKCEEFKVGDYVTTTGYLSAQVGCIVRLNDVIEIEWLYGLHRKVVTVYRLGVADQFRVLSPAEVTLRLLTLEP